MPVLINSPLIRGSRAPIMTLSRRPGRPSNLSPESRGSRRPRDTYLMLLTISKLATTSIQVHCVLFRPPLGLSGILPHPDLQILEVVFVRLQFFIHVPHHRRADQPPRYHNIVKLSGDWSLNPEPFPLLAGYYHGDYPQVVLESDFHKKVPHAILGETNNACALNGRRCGLLQSFASIPDSTVSSATTMYNSNNQVLPYLYD